MDGLLDTTTTPPEEPVQKNQTLPRTKRVHFSTQNSMVQVPRKKSPPPPPPQSSIPSPIQLNQQQQQPQETTKVEIKNPTYDVQSIYSNEYEPIGSENTSSNYYIDMESKLGQEDTKPLNSLNQRSSNHPPDLPPKPPNLMKFKKSNKFQIPPHLIKANRASPTTSNMSEPDYCSISEIQEIVAAVQTVEVEIHKGCDEYSNAGEDTISVSGKTEPHEDDRDEEDSFSDVPKLPNVAEIVSPKKDSINRFITQDNYITKSPLGDSTSHLNIENQKEVESKKILPIPPKKPIPLPKVIKTAPSVSQSLENVAIITDKTQIQAEFDWYNLDAEYGKSNQPDVIRETDPVESENFLKLFDNCSDTSSSRNSTKIEYNLDEEFNLLNQPDIIKKIPEYDGDIKMTTTNNEIYNKKNIKTTVNYFMPTAVETPKLCRNNSTARYETFLEESGLSSKPIIARRKRVYYPGPFV